MGKIDECLEAILQAARGEEVRGSIHDGIQQCYKDAGNLAKLNTEAAEKAMAGADKAEKAAKGSNDATGRADKATTETNAARESTIALRDEVQRKLDGGELIGPVGPQGQQGIQGSQGIQGIQGKKGDKGDQGIQGEKGESGVTASTSGMFSLLLDQETGNLYAEYHDGTTPPSFEFDVNTGNLYYVIGDDT